jgi:hypothetical protein
LGIHRKGKGGTFVIGLYLAGFGLGVRDGKSRTWINTQKEF